MFHFEILLGLFFGFTECVLSTAASEKTLLSLIWLTDAAFWKMIMQFFARFIGTCAVFYVFFLCRMLGAGDIKLMAVIVGCAGIQSGCMILFCGMLLALMIFCIREQVWKYGIVQMKSRELRLAPYLFAGLCLYMAGNLYIGMQGGAI